MHYLHCHLNLGYRLLLCYLNFLYYLLNQYFQQTLNLLYHLNSLNFLLKLPRQRHRLLRHDHSFLL